MAQARELPSTQEGIDYNRKSFSHSVFGEGSLVKNLKRRFSMGINQLVGKKKSIPVLIQNYESGKFKSSLDSGLGSDLSSVKEQYFQTTYAESSSPCSILRSIPTSPTCKKKISFYEAVIPATTHQTRKLEK
jgi:hypothetical protein